MIDRDLSKFSQSDIYSIVCELLYRIKDDESYSAISELAYILEKNSFIKFMQYFGGTTINVPTLQDFKQTIRIIQLYHYFNIQNLSWKEALVKAGFDRNETRSAQRHLMEFTKVLSSFKAGRTYD